MSDKKRIIYKGSMSVVRIDHVGQFKRGQPFSVKKEIADALLRQDPESWSEEKTARAPARGGGGR